MRVSDGPRVSSDLVLVAHALDLEAAPESPGRRELETTNSVQVGSVPAPAYRVAMSGTRCL